MDRGGSNYRRRARGDRPAGIDIEDRPYGWLTVHVRFSAFTLFRHYYTRFSSNFDTCIPHRDYLTAGRAPPMSNADDCVPHQRYSFSSVGPY